MARTAPRVLPAAIVAALLTALVTGAFSGVWDNGFVFDDRDYIVNNRNLDRGLSVEAVRWAFGSFDQANWHPLTWISHLLDATLFGSSPQGPHAVNVLIHAANTVLFFLFLRLATGSAWPSAAAAALFAVHPLRVESVAWIAERKDLLAGLFFLLTLLAYRRYLRCPVPGRYLAVAGLLTLGLLAKPMLVTVPFLLGLLDIWPFGRLIGGGRRPLSALVLEKIPLLALAAASSVVTVLAQARGGALESTQRLPLGARLGNALLSSVKYLAAAVWPVDLSPMYQWPAAGHPLPAVLAAGAVLTATTCLLLRPWRRRPFLALGWLWYLGMLVPVIGLVQVGSQTRADRYTYLPMLGLAVALVWSAAGVARRFHRGPAITAAATVAVLVPLILSTRTQVALWHDDVTLFSRVLAVDPGNTFAHMNLGAQFAEMDRLDEALGHFQAAAIGRPDARIVTNIGKIMALRGRRQEALENYLRALELDPGFTGARFELADLLHDLNRRDEAVAQYRLALGQDPLDSRGRYNLACDLAALGRREEAVAELRELLRQDPGHRGAQTLFVRLQANGPPR